MSNQREKAAAFKVGFLSRLAERGITPDAFFRRAKMASITDRLYGGAESAVKGVAGLGSSAGQTGLKGLSNLLVGAPVAAGSALGMGHALMEAPTEDGIQSLRKAEELATIQRLLRDVRARKVR